MNTSCDLDDIHLSQDILVAVHSGRTADFVGVGIVVYRPPLSLPIVPLGGWSSARPELPIAGARAIGGMLAELSAHQSAWHDGFHFIDAGTHSLTHVSQYLAPVLDVVIAAKPGALPTGARQLTALLASAHRSVCCVGLLTTANQITIYREGRLHHRLPIGHE